MQRILVWDIPTRVFHWLLALSFAGAFLTAETERYRDVHVLFGYTLLGLIAFRLVWGLIGTRYARFRSFLFGWHDMRAYLTSLLTRSPRHYLGHNPAGSLAIYLLLGLGVLSGITGYAAYNDYGGDWLGELHEGLANAMLAVVFVHIAGVLLSSLLHRENLVRSMINGRKEGEPREGIRYAHAWLGILLVAGVVTFWAAAPSSDTSTTTSTSHSALTHFDGKRAHEH